VFLNRVPFAGFVSSLPAESDAAIAQLLLHIPLLRPGNNETKARYVTVIHKVLSHTIETGAHIDKARQLLSYSLIHPAFNGEDRRYKEPSLFNIVP
jgi:hypothetical protein